ncbi:uncharacterized protein BO72DRAFT_232830 [Aspergillus fijiensis CBS 313.89]|uniref:Uncharacterized protein n=1 Tax=Aspergillus fijiensis CBS 313.89 TaxID=1448319 RepID=A0A8G1RKT6_9EURO|nr:uncharacterized protein BO72DRAFT_232830 [Aspergillus fijiensis CBS 313.89]RAK73600.1 hypothetical protein BO72DRAFT_232830 [Aspergillus fijiensis CBS 313.89]
MISASSQIGLSGLQSSTPFLSLSILSGCPADGRKRSHKPPHRTSANLTYEYGVPVISWSPWAPTWRSNTSDSSIPSVMTATYSTCLQPATSPAPAYHHQGNLPDQQS